jgi:hypothetical protein
MYAKHPSLGNKHFPEGSVLEPGWVKWPRSAAEKNAGALPSTPEVVSPSEAVPAPTIESLRAVLEEKGFQYDKRWGLKRLQEAADGNGP